MWTMLCILLAPAFLVGFYGVEVVDASTSVGANSNASSQSVPSPDRRRENLAATVRRFAGSLVHDVPPWVRQRLLEVPVSTECSLGLLKMLRGLSDLEPWALRMVDSTGKLPSGMFTGTITELGAFDECLQTVVRDRHSGRELVRAQYCSLYMKPANDSSLYEQLEPAFLMTHPRASVFLKYRREPWTQQGLRLGICVISDCRQEELQRVANALIGGAVKTEVKHCTTGLTPGLTTSQGAITAIFIIILLLMGAGTFVDLYSADKTNASVGASVLRSFSIPSNLRLLTSTPSDKSSDSYTLRFFHGIRAISIFHVVFGHSPAEYSFSNGAPMAVQAYLDRWDSTLTAAAFLSVDTFFFVSGFLLSYGLNGVKSSQGRVKTTIIIALRRWYRLLLPLVFVACGFSLLPLFVRGPTTDVVYHKFYLDVKGYWWTFLLNIRNFYRQISYGLCVHLWYISADYQLFLPALIVHQLGLGRRVIVGAMAVLSLACCAFTAWQMYGTRFTPFIVHLTDTLEDYVYMLTDVYMLPTYHAACYFGGSITFFAVQKYKNEKISKVSYRGYCRRLLWRCSVGCRSASTSCTFHSTTFG
ncbi:nose resistant to fluoxetine protein 6-like isoform X2 [Haemaphysalis longicornis]